MLLVSEHQNQLPCSLVVLLMMGNNIWRQGRALVGLQCSAVGGSEVPVAPVIQVPISPSPPPPSPPTLERGQTDGRTLDTVVTVRY